MISMPTSACGKKEQAECFSGGNWLHFSLEYVRRLTLQDKHQQAPFTWGLQSSIPIPNHLMLNACELGNVDSNLKR
jgi:hypothetical protein